MANTEIRIKLGDLKRFSANFLQVPTKVHLVLDCADFRDTYVAADITQLLQLRKHSRLTFYFDSSEDADWKGIEIGNINTLPVELDEEETWKQFLEDGVSKVVVDSTTGEL